MKRTRILKSMDSIILRQTIKEIVSLDPGVHVKILPNWDVVVSNDKKIQYRATPDQKTDMKPQGLWYGKGTEWIDWIAQEGGESFAYKHIFRIEINRSKLVRLKSLEDILHFTKDFSPGGAKTFNEAVLSDLRRSIEKDPDGWEPPRETMNNFYESMMIDWEKVAKNFGGIEIAPYIWKARRDPRTRWYYGWDVACGCLWGNNMVKNVKRIM